MEQAISFREPYTLSAIQYWIRGSWSPSLASHWRSLSSLCHQCILKRVAGLCYQRPTQRLSEPMSLPEFSWWELLTFWGLRGQEVGGIEQTYSHRGKRANLFTGKAIRYCTRYWQEHRVQCIILVAWATVQSRLHRSGRAHPTPLRCV